MKKIKVKFMFNQKEWTEYFSRFYEVELSDNPDFVICDSGSALECIYRYDCVRIIWHGENIRPDFNFFDYAMGFDKLTFGDRYLHYPLYLGYERDFKLAFDKHLGTNEEFLAKKKFCNFVVSNGRAANRARDEMFDLLSKYKQVDSGGRYRNNLSNGKPVADKLEFQKQYKFSLAFENSSYKGYTTEKLVQAFAAGTIPIYWGDPDITDDFNKDAFVNVTDYPSFEAAIEKIKEIDQNDELFLKMLRTPMVREDGEIPKMMKKEYQEEFLRHIFDQDREHAMRRTNAQDGWGLFAERDAKKFWDMEHSKVIQTVYKVERRLKNRG